MAAFRKEIQELVDELTGDAHPGESWPDRAHHIARELFDVVGKVVNLGDDPTSSAEIKLELEAASAEIVLKVFKGRPVLRMAAAAAVPYVAGLVIDAIENYTGTAEQFVDEHLLPHLAECESTIHRMRISLEG